MKKNIKNIGFISTRIAGTDGVSLEIEKWATVLEKCLFRCCYFAGELNQESHQSYRVPKAHFAHPKIMKLQKALFSNKCQYEKLSEKIHNLKDALKEKLYAFKNKFDIDLIIAENVLAIPMNIPLGLAVAEFIAETNIPTVAHHHDFYWERERFQTNLCREYLEQSFPPDLPSIKHVVINKIAQQQLKRRTGIISTLIPNVCDFSTHPNADPVKSKQLRKIVGLEDDDPFILQPTRIIPRKKIGHAIVLVSLLNLSNPTLIISHASGDEGDEYFKHLMELAESLNVKLKFVDHLISSKEFSLSDVYQSADLITYLSSYEGFGNAFLESIYFKKPIFVRRYPVFISDIEPKGFDVIKVDDTFPKEIIEDIRNVLTNKVRLKKMVDKNFELGERYFSFRILEDQLVKIIRSFE